MRRAEEAAAVAPCIDQRRSPVVKCQHITLVYIAPQHAFRGSLLSRSV